MFHVGRKITSLGNHPLPRLEPGLLSCTKLPQAFLFTVTWNAKRPAREATESLLSRVHKSHGVYGSFGFLPSNQVLAGGALAGVESPRPGGGGRRGGEGRSELRGGGRVKFLLRWTSGTGEDHRAGRVSRAHGTEEGQDREKTMGVCVCASWGRPASHKSIIQDRGCSPVTEQRVFHKILMGLAGLPSPFRFNLNARCQSKTWWRGLLLHFQLKSKNS